MLRKPSPQQTALELASLDGLVPKDHPLRKIIRHVWADARERTDANRLTPWGKRIYKRRKETVERSSADAKQLHGHRYTRFRGLLAVTFQCLLAAAAQNIKKIALALTPRPLAA